MDPDLARRLEELSALHTAGKISDTEHERERTRILGRVSAPTGPVTTSTARVQLPPTTAAVSPPAVVQPPRPYTQFVPLGAPPPAYGLPLPSVPAADGRAPSRTTRWALVAGVAVLLLVVGIGVFVLVGGSSGDNPALLPSPPPQSGLPAQQQLDGQVRTDAAAVEKLVDRWVPQLLAERVGSADGTQVAGDAESVLGSYRAVAGRRPGVLLLSSAFSSFERPGFYVVVEPMAFATPAEALGWCVAQGLGRDQCFAKWLSHTAGPAGSTSYQ